LNALAPIDDLDPSADPMTVDVELLADIDDAEPVYGF
jgi:hypothetical protein